MPTYDYVCDACQYAFEEFQSISAKPLKKCPQCGKTKLKRLIGVGAGIIFKGSGFYQTDYRSDSYKASEKKESDAAKPAEATSAAKSSEASTATTKNESKPATPPKTPKPQSKTPAKPTSV